jgi:hypothetical protein
MRLFGVSLGEGNMKVGEVFNFSLPSITTCPGASKWCLKHCYAYRYERLRPACRRAYARNLALTKDIKRFARTMIGIVPRILPCFRIHVSGDFFSRSYLEGWREICSAFPQSQFWAYTRSWTAVGLLAPLEQLKALSNVQLFASTDPTMPLPPEGWRVAFVDTDPRARGILCSKQTEEEDSCLACGYCFRQDTGDVIFRVH